ncbi:FAD dependent oxidoreductase [Microdochium trichocladiopsis]|uniref:FAD dependent oxidoreductase n=1 Tax=Microdochium trichocladiopsis TaxID=1682393 RepID=A0A9P8Y0A9_9PEZI|nr:FAD dependent oxidoreductase [Microdochium trichocladiopsis]KAH7025666.1 FAD dependent oxidoreductase [Microdochium trichocladiopsis]
MSPTDTSKSARPGHRFVVLGAGVIGLSTALTLWQAYSDATITIIAAHFPGDYHIEYASPWAGANWCSSATDNGLLESYDRITYNKFAQLAAKNPECGVASSPLRMIYDSPIEQADVLSPGTGKVWYDQLVGGLSIVPINEMPQGAIFALDAPQTFVINTQIYLRWLVAECRSKSIHLMKRKIKHIQDLEEDGSTLAAIFNCTGLGSFSLGGVEDKALYPSRGQTVLVEQPSIPLERMYFRSSQRFVQDATYVFQRPLAGGVVLGGCRQDGNWNPKVDFELARQIMDKCCALAPELGKPEDLKVLQHGVGLRPCRRGGPRIELETRGGQTVVVHNYGAGGTGYQASWGMAARAVQLFRDANLTSQVLPKL